ncbi:MAG: c-type cytochrome biogenesis protein CcsB [Acidobacteriota bacterium]
MDLPMGGLLFNAAFGFYVVGLFHSGVAFLTRRDLFVRVAQISVALGFVFHTGFLIHRGFEKSFLPMIGLRESLAFFAWTVVLCFLIAQARYRIRALGLFLLPLVAAFMLSTVFIKASPIPDMLRSSWVLMHSTFMFLAYGMFFVVFVAGALYLLQERELKGKRTRTFYHQLPSLNVLDDFFLKFLISGFLFMTLGLVAGMIWAEKEWVDGWAHDPKVISAMSTWSIYLALLYLRLTAGWRGRRAALISMVGFLCVLFTFFGVSFFGGQHRF